MADSDLVADLAVVLRAVSAAGERARARFRSGEAVHYKSASQPVTATDLQVDRLLRTTLGDARPEYGWLSEETADSTERLDRSHIWIVDPIDGTYSFVEGRPEFAICVGLAVRGEAVLGVVSNPVTGELFHAVAGSGAFLNGQPIRVSAPNPGSEERALVVSHSELRRGDFVALPPSWNVRPLGSTAYKMVQVAMGAVDGYVSHGPKSEWDVCAPAVIVREAGGIVSRLDGTPIRYNQRQTGWRGVVASNGATHAELLRVAAMSEEQSSGPNGEAAYPSG